MGKCQAGLVQSACIAALLLFTAAAASGRYGSYSLDDKQIGFCTLEGGTTGGAGGKTVTASDAETLKGYMDSNDTLIIGDIINH